MSEENASNIDHSTHELPTLNLVFNEGCLPLRDKFNVTKQITIYSKFSCI